MDKIIKLAQPDQSEIDHDSGIPEHALLRSMIGRAIMDLARGQNHASKDRGYIRRLYGVYADAYEWIFPKEVNPELEWSFDWVCDELSIDADHIRSAISVLIGKSIKIGFRNKPYLDPMYKVA